MSPDVAASSELAAGHVIPPRRFGPFSAKMVAAYAEASGDDNPLHSDASLAARAGLARPPIHGMLIMGCFEPYLHAWRPAASIVKLSGKFIRPVLVGDSIEVSGKVVQAAAGVPAVLRLMVRGDDGRDLVCLAEAFVEP
ncbi:MaoC family dehydratase [Beijerinckia sp. L45]|uniref:MaoC family dehydratase n=1 Tax=Beijerinckia sp. L45 TaxID=1641855 RepID=UPI001FEE1B81|nr:MaoC family dehydratase [Beijerinckia sp. L45]